MILVTAVSLYTSRIALEVLGIDNYGIYSVIGGLIALMGGLTGIMAGATQRFLTYAIGSKNEQEIQLVFSTAVIIHIITALLLIICGETLGLYYFYNHLNIPLESKTAGMWVLQCTMLSMAVNITQIPYNSILIAYERMNIFAGLSILEVILKLILTFSLFLIPAKNVLIGYALLLLASQIILRLISQSYVRSHFKIPIKLSPRDPSLLKRMTSFAGWSFLGTLSYISLNQAIPIIVNIFAGVVANAAIGLANQVTSVASQFVTNFQTAFKPQIVKFYAEHKIDQEMELFYLSSKFSFFILLIIVFPLINEMNYVLTIWLKEVPPDTAIFCKLTLIYVLVDTLTVPILTMIEATGNIKKYYTWVSAMFLLFIPISYISLKLGYPIYSIFVIKIILSILIHIVRLKILAGQYEKFKWEKYLRNVMLPIVLVIIVPMMITFWTKLQINSFTEFLAYTLTYILIAAVSIYFLGLNKKERIFIISKTHTVIDRWKR